MSRFQNNIYIQTAYQGVRNKDILNVNTSSDFCVFNAPQYIMSGASKVPCNSSLSAITSGTSYVFVVDPDETTKEITFEFTGNTDSFITNNSTFKYEIYKYDTELNSFHTPPQYRSEEINYSSFSGTSILTQTIPLTTLDIDGEFLIKGNFVHDVCTEFANKLGYSYDTSSYVSGSEFGIYNPDTDYYMLIMKAALTPIFENTITGGNIGAIKQYSVIPIDGQREFLLTVDVGLDFVVTLNGLTLSIDEDYSVTQFSGGSNPYLVTFIDDVKSTDIVSFIYVNSSSEVRLKTDIIDVTSIPSGPTDGEGPNKVYYNTTTDKYEAFTSLTPRNGNDILVMVNGVTLAFGIDYYQSITNPKRIIFEGIILVNDIILIAYNSNAPFVDNITQSEPTIFWRIAEPPKLNNGYFTLEFSTGGTFTTITSSATTDYIPGEINYNASVTITGDVGTQLYYRVTNTKNYSTLCGDIITSTADSEIIPIIIATNYINSY